MKTSVGEFQTQLILEKMKIPYRREIELGKLTGTKKSQFPADFLIQVDDKIGIIEFNGRQHYRATGDWSKSLEEMGKRFNRRLHNDQHRRQYIFDAGIPLLEIHFKDFDEIKSIIKHFVTHIKTDCSKRETDYGQFSKGYFAPITKRKSKAYRHAWLLFAEEPHASNTGSIQAGELVADMGVVDEKYGYILLNDDRIIWTKEKFHGYLKKVKNNPREMEKLKDEIGKLQSAYDLLKNNHDHEIKLLHEKEEKIRQENDTFHANQSTKLNNRIMVLEAENEKLKAAQIKNKEERKEFQSLLGQIDAFKIENRKLKNAYNKLKSNHVKKIDSLKSQIEALKIENKTPAKKLKKEKFFQKLSRKWREQAKKIRHHLFSHDHIKMKSK